MKKFLNLIAILILGSVLAVSISTVLGRLVIIAKTEEQIENIRQEIKDQQIQNDELSDVLSDENKDDFYRRLAEDLGYGYIDEKIYIDITGY